MKQMLTVFISLITISMGIPLLQHQLIDLSEMDAGDLAQLLLTPHLDTSNHLTDTLHIKETSHGVSDKLRSGGVHAFRLIESQKDASIGAALIPTKVWAESGAVGGAITAMAGVKGSLVGSAIATPIILKAVALPGLAAGKTAAVMAVPALLTHNLKEKIHDSTRQLINKGTHALKNGAIGVGLLKASALGLAEKGALVMKKGAVVAGKLILKPIAIIAGSQLKMIGTGLTIGGKVVGATGANVKKAGAVMKYAGLGSIGLGASAIGWGLDKTTIDGHFQEIDKSHKST